jgi:hypothetical protein
MREEEVMKTKPQVQNYKYLDWCGSSVVKEIIVTNKHDFPEFIKTPNILSSHV